MWIRAGHMRPGHQRVGFFKFGPSTFVDLEEMELEYRPRTGEPYRVRCPRARLTRRQISCAERAIVQRGEGAPRPGRGVEIDLDNGRLRVGDFRDGPRPGQGGPPTDPAGVKQKPDRRPKGPGSRR